ncbi:structural protein [Lactobacillus phage 521B]|uniref:Structural protein n=1 Tax=Lactobacillus phage 521B TaxID=2510942 RepID=A0A4Y5FEJ2_9CAUD|nr:structural protein [Lactobacillus phage 521B]QBJ03436.1 structural protein [Lactobacillus phage 521B]
MNEADFSKILEEATKETIDKDIDMETLKNITVGNIDSESIVIKNNQELTENNYPIVMLYGFNDYLSLYRYSKAVVPNNSEGYRKFNLNRYESNISVFNPIASINTKESVEVPSYNSHSFSSAINKSEIKNPLPNKENKKLESSDQAKEEEKDKKLTYGLVGEALDKVSDTAISKINKLPKNFITNGTQSLNYDNYAYINLNGTTIAIIGLKIDNKIQSKYLAYNPEYKNLISEFVKALALISRENKKDLVIEKEVFENNPIISLLCTKENNKQATIKLKDICLEE